MKKMILVLLVVFFAASITGCTEESDDVPESNVPETQPETPQHVNSVSASGDVETEDSTVGSASFFHDMFMENIQERQRYGITADGVNFVGILLAVSDTHVILDTDENSVYIIEINSIDAVTHGNITVYQDDDWMERHGFTTGKHYEIFKQIDI